jgi:hypothetical protein
MARMKRSTPVMISAARYHKNALAGAQDQRLTIDACILELDEEQ